MKVISTKIVDGKKMFLIEEPTKLFAQNGFSSNPYYVPIQGSISDNTKTKLSPKKELSKEEIKQLQKSPTSVKNIKAKEVEDKNQRLKLSEQAYKKRIKTGIQSSQELADETGAIGDKISLKNLPYVGKYIPDILDVTGGIGSMASGLGRIPLNIKNKEYGQAALSVAMPLGVGALAGVGTQNTGQFVNNLANPLAGTGELINNLGNKYLPNAYKLNPKALKEAQEQMLVRARPVGQDPYINMAEQLKAKQAAGEQLTWYQKNLLNPQTNPQMAAREKYFGQWFADNPSDLDFYINPGTRNFADDAQIEILKARMPKSEAVKYNVKNFEDAKKLSNLHDTEFILPKDMVQQLERHSVDDLPKLIKEYNEINKPHWLKGYKEVEVPKSNFKSEIDWGKWNKEIPDNKALMQEYNTIEQQAKADGTWMKNPDGSAFQGTPEQFVQQNSENFKKAFPEGSENVFRGTGENIAELRPNRSIFTANQELASGYAPFNKKSIFLNSESGEGGVHSFYRKNSKNSLELDANNTSWTSVDLSNKRLTKDYFERNIKFQEEQLLKRKNDLSKLKQLPNGSWTDGGDYIISNDLYKNWIPEQELYLRDLKERYKNIDNLISNPKELEEMRKVLGNTSTTDDIATYVEKRNLDYVKLKNIEDSGVGDVTIVNHKPGNYLKSAIGNNGMFDMTNPNIYKTIVGGLATGTLGKEAMRKKEFGGKIKVLDTKIENGKKYFLINDIEKNNTFEKGGSVSDIYKQKTGKNWNTAKLEGLTTGSYEDNIKLKNRLLSGEFDNKQVVNSNTINNQDYTKAKNFNEAFKIARQQLGTNQIFEYQGRKYGTNIAGEKFEPSKDVLEKAGMNIPNVKKSLHEQNKLVNSVYSTKKTTKLEPEYQDWEKIRQRQQEINKMNQVDIIKEYHKGSNEQYLVLDKKRGKVHLYQGNKEITSYNVGTGENIGDEQTRTWVEKGTGKVDWSKGNKQTGAGIYTVSGKTSKNAHYSNVPSWNFKNDQGIEVPMAIHASTPGRIGKIQDKDESNNRVSNGCINGLCYDLEDLYKRGYKEGQKLYVLPDDDKNTYEISNGKLIFKSNSSDVNRSVNTLNYKPIQIQYNKYLKENAPEVANMTQAIVNNKQKLMKELKINGDVYNELAKLTLGLAGQESKYGTSFKFKAKTEFTQDILKNITGNKSYNSKGLTQIKYDGVNDEVKKIFKKYNITKENLNQGDKAALAQIILLSHMYNNELPAYRKNIDEVGISDIDALLYLNQGKRKELVNKTATPEKNTYIQSVKKFAEDFKIKQLN